MNRDELIAYFLRGLRENHGREGAEEGLARNAATLADAFLENRVERPGKDPGGSGSRSQLAGRHPLPRRREPERA